LYCLSFNCWLLIGPLVSSNFSYTWKAHDFTLQF
jgi:hypothetical protein